MVVAAAAGLMLGERPEHAKAGRRAGREQVETRRADACGPDLRRPPADAELVAAVRHGDDRAFGLLYARYRDPIRGYVARTLGDHARAEDLVQDVFISALRRLRATDGLLLFKPWVYEIAKNACIDEWRRARRAIEVSLDGEDQQAELGRLSAPALTPETAAAVKQRLQDLRGAFRGLSENHHRILVLRELEGLSYHQIGDRLGLSKPVVESTLFRARRRLSEEFDEIESGRRCARVQQLIEDERALGLRERRLVERHLTHCSVCRRDARDGGRGITPLPASLEIVPAAVPARAVCAA